MHQRRIVGIGLIVVVLFVFGVSQSQAQSSLTLEGLSDRIMTLARRISSLSNTKANKYDLAALENRVATLEAKSGDVISVSTATRRRPTSTPIPNVVISTPTRGRPTSTPTPAREVVTVISQLAIRSGPSNRFEVVGVASKDDELTITGKNASGTWWRVDYKGANAWVYGPSYTNDNISIVSTPVWPTNTPRPTNTSKRIRPTLTPRPTRTPTRVRPTATRRPPTSTPTRPRPTATATSAQVYITITRNMNVRRGPGTNYVVLGYATIGEEFDINGRNTDGSWWRISFDGRNGWIYAPFVTAFNAGNVPVVEALAPLPTDTPRPQPTQGQYSSVEYATILMGMDWKRSDLQRRWSSLSKDQQTVMLLTIAAYLELTAEYCNMSLQDAGRMINEHGQNLDDSGYTIRNDIRARSFLMLVLTEAEEAAHTPYGCDRWLSQATSRLLAAE